MEVGNAIAQGGIGNAIGSTEPTAEERCHWTPEMVALAVRDGEELPANRCCAEAQDDDQGTARG